VTDPLECIVGGFAIERKRLRAFIQIAKRVGFLLADDFHEDAFAAAAIEVAVEDLFAEAGKVTGRRQGYGSADK
jgi:hypothetical protein